jgi:hypothetical protein
MFADGNAIQLMIQIINIDQLIFILLGETL